MAITDNYCNPCFWISRLPRGKEVSRMERIKKFLKEEEGVTMIEYGLLAALIAVALIATVKLVQTGLITTFSAVSGNLTAAS